MINCNSGVVQIRGKKNDVLADLSTAIHVLHFEVFVGDGKIPPEKSREMIMDAVEYAFKTEDELSNKQDELKNDVLKTLDELRSILLGKDEE